MRPIRYFGRLFHSLLFGGVVVIHTRNLWLVVVALVVSVGSVSFGDNSFKIDRGLTDLLDKKTANVLPVSLEQLSRSTLYSELKLDPGTKVDLTLEDSKEDFDPNCGPVVAHDRLGGQVTLHLYQAKITDPKGNVSYALVIARKYDPMVERYETKYSAVVVAAAKRPQDLRLPPQ
jgi:hypothetical protein